MKDQLKGTTHTKMELVRELNMAREECEEQARLNGMGAERELILRTALETARVALNEVYGLVYAHSTDPRLGELVLNAKRVVDGALGK